MMYCTMSAAWSHLVLSLCCTEHGPSCDIILSGCITWSSGYRQHPILQDVQAMSLFFFEFVVRHSKR
jgi:hypothetical protein